MGRSWDVEDSELQSHSAVKSETRRNHRNHVWSYDFVEAQKLQIYKSARSHRFFRHRRFPGLDFTSAAMSAQGSAQPKLRSMSVLRLQPLPGLGSLQRFRLRQRRLMASSVASKVATIGKPASSFWA